MTLRNSGAVLAAAGYRAVDGPGAVLRQGGPHGAGQIAGRGCRVVHAQASSVVAEPVGDKVLLFPVARSGK
jgi:hypothetical protein